jgi:hypothetical protein
VQFSPASAYDEISELYKLLNRPQQRANLGRLNEIGLVFEALAHQAGVGRGTLGWRTRIVR